MDNQRTIRKEIVFKGKGLHTGQEVEMKLSPLPENSGIVFVRSDQETPFVCKADIFSVANFPHGLRRTSIGRNNIYIHTIEHLMAAFSILGIDNVQVVLDGEEVPGMDGSAAVFLERIKEAGICEQTLARNFFVVKEPLWVEEKNASIAVLPYPQFRITYMLQYENSVIGTELLDIVFDGNQEESLACARTFCLEEEVDPLKKLGLGKGANFTNTLVVSAKGILDNKVRVPDEFVRHKVLDLIGDLYLAGALKGHVIALRSGHTANIQLLHKLKVLREKSRASGVGSVSGYVPQGKILGASEIMQILPHRYPFLLVDKIVDMEPNQRAVGIKNVTVNESFFQGHFPGKPVMPGVLIVEAMAQVGGVLMLANPEHQGKLAFFMAADQVKFRKTVEPGDQLVIEVKVGKIKQKTGQVHTKATVDGKVVAEGDLMFALVER